MLILALRPKSIWLHSKQQQHASQHLVIFLILEKNICCFRCLILQAFSISLAALLSYSCSVLNKFKFCCPLYFCPMLHCMDPFVFLHSCYCVHSNQKSWHLVDAAAIVFPCYTISIVKTNLHHTFVWLNWSQQSPANNRSFWPSAIFNFHLSILFSALVRIWNTGIPMQPVCWTRARYQWTDCWVCLHPFQSRVSNFWQGTYIQGRTFL